MSATVPVYVSVRLPALIFETAIDGDQYFIFSESAPVQNTKDTPAQLTVSPDGSGLTQTPSTQQSNEIEERNLNTTNDPSSNATDGPGEHNMTDHASGPIGQQVTREVEATKVNSQVGVITSCSACCAC